MVLFEIFFLVYLRQLTWLRQCTMTIDYDSKWPLTKILIISISFSLLLTHINHFQMKYWLNERTTNVLRIKLILAMLIAINIFLHIKCSSDEIFFYVFNYKRETNTLFHYIILTNFPQHGFVTWVLHSERWIFFSLLTF